MWRDDPATIAKERANKEIRDRAGSTFEPGVAADKQIVDGLRFALTSTVVTVVMWAGTMAIDQQTHMSQDASAVLHAHKERVRLPALNCVVVGCLIFVMGFVSWLHRVSPTAFPQCLPMLAASMLGTACVLVWHAYATFQAIGSAETLCGSQFRGTATCNDSAFSNPTAELTRWLIGGLYSAAAALQVVGALQTTTAVRSLRKDEAINQIVLSCASCSARRERAEWQRLIRDKPVFLI